MKLRSTKRNDFERGQSMVELAMGFMVLMILIAGIVDLSRLLVYSVSLRDAAEEGVHYGSLQPALPGTNDTSSIISHVRTTLDSTVNITVAYSRNGSAILPGAACTGSLIKVTVTQPSFQLETPFLGAILGGQTIPLSSSYNGVVLRPACP
jgi:Flp pilus assembly protein TadG